MLTSIRQSLYLATIAAFFTSSALYAKTDADSEITLNNITIAKQLSQEFASIAKKATPAVVTIVSKFQPKQRSGPQEWDDPMDPFQDEFWQRFFGVPNTPQQRAPRMGQGSGFTISSDGFILTNNHVVQDAEEITVIFNNGKEKIASIVGTDPSTDIALIKVEDSDLEYLTLGDSDKIEVGELVMAIGSPFRFQSTVSTGVVSAKGRSGIGAVPIENFIQTDAAINMGNSGGCLISLSDGAVIGMNTAIISNTGGYVGIGFAIPSNIIKHVMEELRTKGRVVRGYVGVNLQVIDSKLADAFSLDKNQGALVAEVVKDSPAEAAGLLSGDIILKINGQTVENPSSLRSTIAMVKPGDSVIFGVLRSGKMTDVTCVVGTHPESEIASSELQNKLGMLFQDLTPEIAKQLGYEQDLGVLIKYVDPNSNAHEIGLRRGQLIVSVNQKPIVSTEELFRILQENPKQKRILLQVKFGQVTRYVPLDLQ